MAGTGENWDGMANGELSGEYGVKLDDMGRIGLPRQLREAVEDSELVLVRGGLPRLPCLWLLTAEKWAEKKREAAESASLSYLDRLNGKLPAGIDKQGRIVIQPTLRKYAKLSKDCILVGQDDRIVVWAEDRYDEHLEADGENFVAEEKELRMLKLRGKGLGNGGDCAHSGAAGADAGASGPEGGGAAYG